MKKRFGLAVIAGVILTPVVSTVVSAGPPEGYCPSGAWWVEGTPTEGHRSEFFDLNGDHTVCGLFLPPGGLALMDNVVRKS